MRSLFFEGEFLLLLEFLEDVGGFPMGSRDLHFGASHVFDVSLRIRGPWSLGSSSGGPELPQTK